MSLSVTDQCIVFWTKIERSISKVVPTHVKNILNVAGYDSPITIKELNANDLVELECFAQRIPQLISNYCADKNIKIDGNQLSAIHQLFLGLYAGRPKEFKFHKGENVLILLISNFVKVKVTRANGENDYSFFIDAGCDAKLSSTTGTFVGKIFGEENQQTKKRRILQTIQEKKETQCPVKGKTLCSPTINKNFETNVNTNNVDFEVVKEVLIQSCMKQATFILSEYCRSHVHEIKFINESGIKSVEELIWNIILNERDLKCIEEMEVNVKICASIICYCKKQHTTSAVYFRGKSNWMEIISTAKNQSIAVENLKKCWSLVNFKRHLSSHKKYYVVEELDHDEAAIVGMNDEQSMQRSEERSHSDENCDNERILEDARKIPMTNDQIEQSIQKCFKELISEENLHFRRSSESAQVISMSPDKGHIDESEDSVHENNTSGVRLHDQPKTTSSGISVDTSKRADSNLNSIQTNSANSLNGAEPHWAVPRPYEDEPEQAQVAMILKWILGDISTDDILNGKQEVTVVTSRLDNMKNNGYMRLFEINLNIVKKYMSSGCWALLQDFKQKHKDDKCVCPQCESFLGVNEYEWQCNRCLLRYHLKCSRPKELKKPGNSSTFRLCLACLFTL